MRKTLAARQRDILYRLCRATLFCSGDITQFGARHATSSRASSAHITWASYQTLSKFWIPSIKGRNANPRRDDANQLLHKTGFLQQAHAGVFHLLPLGQRVQEKIERLVERHMRSLGASKVALSSLSSTALWAKSGRWKQDEENSQFMRLAGDAPPYWLLAPTHEEEITELVAQFVRSPKDLPVRLFQISRKYREERRPRKGLLRSREFLMKDLYTFDANNTAADVTYQQVRNAYRAIMQELKIPYLEAEASSGDMGGNLSHEFHYEHPDGEDLVLKCSRCNYAANNEVAKRVVNASAPMELRSWVGLSKDSKKVFIVWYNGSSARADSNSPTMNLYALSRAIPELDTAQGEESLSPNGIIARLQKTSSHSKINQIVHAFVGELAETSEHEHMQIQIQQKNADFKAALNPSSDSEPEQQHLTFSQLDLELAQDGDACPQCQHGTLKSHQTIEIGHTFHLGARYSAVLDAKISDGQSGSKEWPMVMGCHGIGISRLLATIAAKTVDSQGFNWPPVVAPWNVIVVPPPNQPSDVAEGVLCALEHRKGSTESTEHQPDVVLDDRDMSLIAKLKDADLIGYPVIVVLGDRNVHEGNCEVQCRRLQVNEIVPLGNVEAFVADLFARM